jgi:heptaprenyl diphosphate synthase/octaprenyl-diphosphate synthase
MMSEASEASEAPEASERLPADAPEHAPDGLSKHDAAGLRTVHNNLAGPAAASMPPLPRDARAIFAHAGLEDDLAAIETLLFERTASRSDSIAAAGAHIVHAGGKRLRAAVALLAARLGSYDFARTRHAAAAVELIHAASLVHDDLVDRTDRRRGHATVHTRWDNDVALMVGDYFFALAAAEMAMCPDQRIITFYAQAVQTIVSGELHPVTHVEPCDTALKQYFFKTGAKTAALFEAGCKAGMATGSGSDEQIAALGQYGYAMGTAFQIVDDILDFIGDEQTLGKPAGNDLRQGTITLPLIYAAAASDNPLLRAVVAADNPDDAAVQQAVAAVIAAGGVEHARAEAERYTREAIAHLDGFAPSPARQALIDIARFSLARQA